MSSRRRREKAFNPRLRTRAGATVRKRWTRIVKGMRDPHKCPNCHMPYVSRESVGIWECSKCGYKFAGAAFTPSTKLGRTSHGTRQQR
jgi:large subunit ribosomal protein L37Ae